MPEWSESLGARVVGQGILQPNPDQVYVPCLRINRISFLFLSGWPQRKIIHSQTISYNAMGLGGADSFTACGIKDILVLQPHDLRSPRVRFPDTKAYLVLCCVDGAV